jgi:peptidoglycan hydrolase CwlO-like protein
MIIANPVLQERCMVILEKKFTSYNEANYNSLMAEFKDLSTLTEASEWDQRAQAEVDRINNVVSDLKEKLAQRTKELAQMQNDRNAKPIFSRIFASKKPEQEISQEIAQVQTSISHLMEMGDTLRDSIDFTPNSPAEKKALLAELRIHKKELEADKREVALTMNAIRAEARQKNADIDGRASYDSKSAAQDRRQVHYEKEAALQPHEDTKAAIERQILQVEKDILRVEKFLE